jgi:hypothetical protein
MALALALRIVNRERASKVVDDAVIHTPLTADDGRKLKLAELYSSSATCFTNLRRVALSFITIAWKRCGRAIVVSRSQTIIYSVSIEGGRDDNFIYRAIVRAQDATRQISRHE